jgi:hypothetical protein
MVDLTKNMNEVEYDNFNPFVENVLRAYFTQLNFELNEQIHQQDNKDTLEQIVEKDATESDKELEDFQDLDEESEDENEIENENEIEEGGDKNSFVDIAPSENGT